MNVKKRGNSLRDRPHSIFEYQINKHFSKENCETFVSGSIFNRKLNSGGDGEGESLPQMIGGGNQPLILVYTIGYVIGGGGPTRS